MMNGGAEVTETVAATSQGKQLEMNLLVNNAVATVGDDGDGKCRHSSGNGIRPECMS